MSIRPLVRPLVRPSVPPLVFVVYCEGKHPLIMSVAYHRPVIDLPYLETLCGLIK